LFIRVAAAFSLALFPSALLASDPAAPAAFSELDVSSVPVSDAFADKSVSPANASSKTGRFREKVVSGIDEILRKALSECPVLRRNISDESEVEILRALCAALGDGLEYHPPKGKHAVSPDKEAGSASVEARDGGGGSPKPKRGLSIASNRVLYVRIDSFDEASVKTLAEDLTSAFRQLRKPVGVILDLRSASGGDVPSAVAAVGLFVSSGKLPKCGIRYWAKASSVPVVILIGRGTSGPAEVFASLAMAHGNVVTLGQPSLGRPFPRKEVGLSNGGTLSVPLIPKGLEEVPRSPVPSSIQCAAAPVVGYEELRGKKGTYKKDACLKRAVDLVICLEAISSR